MKPGDHSSRRAAPRRHAIATAVALLGLLGPVLPSQAQYYAYSGTVSTYPGSLFPIDTSNPVLDLGVANTLWFGYGAPGSFSALSGAQLSVGALRIGDQGNGNGSMTVDGAQVLVGAGGTTNRIELGSWGTGSMLVTNGGLVDATVNAAACVAATSYCYTFVGNAAGSVASLTVSGTGSEVRTLRNFVVGGLAVFTQAHDGFTFGTPGASTHSSVNVLAGGVLRTEGATIGTGPGGGAPLGTETSFADVVVDGVGSQWIITRNSIDGGAAFAGIGNSANASASLVITGGGLVRVDGTGSPGPNDGINVGSGGKGTLMVAGAGSRLETTGVNPFINVSTRTSTVGGSFQVLAGGSAQTLYLNVGRGGGNGQMLIDGDGSALRQVGVGVVNPGNAGTPAFAHIGRDGGTGQATVSNGALWLISDGGQDDRAGNSSPGFAVGRGAGSTGSLTITGAGSVVRIVGNTLGQPAGEPDNFNPFVGIGYDNAATTSGTLTVSNGGKLILTGNAVSTPTASRTTSLNIGGRNGTAGTGSATVTGAGSAILVQGNDAYIGVGRTAGGSGSLSVLDQARVSSTSLVVGVETSGTVTVDNAKIALSGYRTNTTPMVGAGLSVGRGSGGVGALNLNNGATLTITPTLVTGGMSLGGDQFEDGGTGVANLAGGSSIQYTPLALGGEKDYAMIIGRTGNGTMSLAGASVVDIGAMAEAALGSKPGGVGSLSIASGSAWRGGALFVGGHDDGAPGGSGSVTVSGLNSQLAMYGTENGIAVGKTGSGSLAVSNNASVSATVMAVGRNSGSIGSVLLDQSTLTLSGQQTTGSLYGATWAIGVDGTGSANVGNGSQVTISNTGSAGATLALGGAPALGGSLALVGASGSGSLTVSGGSQVSVSGPPGLARAYIGYNGSGSASFSGGSRLSVSGGSVIIAGQPGSTGTLVLSSGSVLTADYVGVGSNPGGIDGGVGSLYVNNSTVNATTVEIGSQSLLGGSDGVINAHVINRGTLSPGNSPGRVKIDGRIDNPDGSQILLDVESDGHGGFLVDQVVLTQTTSFEFDKVKVTFRFLGDTDPVAAGQAGVMDMDSFLRVATASGDAGLSTAFANGQTWNTVLAQATFAATSPDYDVSGLKLAPDGSGSFSFTATPVPEPGSALLWLGGLLGLGARLRRRLRYAA